MPVKSGIFAIASDNLVHLTGLQMADGTIINNAVVTATLEDDDGNAVDVGGPIPFTYVANSAGNYDGIIPHTAAMTEGQAYNLFVTVTVGTTQMDVRVRRNAMYVDD